MKASDLNKEFAYEGSLYNGFLMLFVNLIVLPGIVAAMFCLTPDPAAVWLIVSTVVIGLLSVSYTHLTLPTTERV